MRPAVVVTGGAGFIGSHVVDALLAADNEVLVIDDLSSGRSERVAAGATLEVLDVVDGPALTRVIDGVRPAAIFHLAAQASVTASVTDPSRDCAVNVAGTLNVVEAARRHSAPVVFTSTGGALYGNEAPLPTGEDFMPAPLAPYGASKWAGESYVTTWTRAHAVPHAVCRLGNVYGPRQSPHGEAGVVSIFSLRLWRGEAPTLYGNGLPTRDYVHVSDVVAALLAASGHAGVFNIATGVETDVAALYAELQRAAGTTLEPQLAPLREGELERSCLDASLARQTFGWQAKVSLQEGLHSTYAALVAEFESESA